MATDRHWQPITDRTEGPALTDSEPEALLRVWQDQRNRLEQRGSLAKFNGQLSREWAIETGVIEGAYNLDRGTTRVLIEKGVEASLISHDEYTSSPERTARLIQDHIDTLETMFAFVREERTFTTAYVKEIHAALLRNIETFTVEDQFGRMFDKPLRKGSYKLEPNNPTRPDGSVHFYCPPEHVASEMDRLVSLHADHESLGVPTEVEAAWLHHAFSEIHPFEDGNGRVARALASLVFIKAGWFPLVVTRDDRTRYIEALEKADDGDLRPLVALFVALQRRTLGKAVEVASSMEAPQSVDEAIAAARDRLIVAGEISPPEWVGAKVTAKTVLQVSLRRLRDLANDLTSQIASRPGFRFSVASGEGLPEALLPVGGSLP